jgi:Tol biopolymer transport system component
MFFVHCPHNCLYYFYSLFYSPFPMKKFILIFIIACWTADVFPQEIVNAYDAESSGYFVSPVQTALGIVVTDNSFSKIYLVDAAKNFKILVDVPGCGRYFSVSPSKTKIGFKLIRDDGSQVPAYYDLNTETIIELESGAPLCGQVTFTSHDAPVYTRGNIFLHKDGKNKTTAYLKTYANITAFSSDENSLVFNSEDDQLFLLDFSSGKKTQITFGPGGFAYPQWSPDGQKLVYSSLNGSLYVWEKNSGKTYALGRGAHPSWSDNSELILYDNVNASNFEFKGAEIYVAKYDGSLIRSLTKSSTVHEMQPSFVGSNKIIYSTYSAAEVVTADFDGVSLEISNEEILFSKENSSARKNNSAAKLLPALMQSIVMVPGTVPYVHQKYDTPDWHAGSGSCAPTTSSMVLAYYNRLPYWDITCSSPSSHISHYGNYVADYYRYNEIYYNVAAGDAAGNNACGGFGYMWNGSSSPYQSMATYLTNHDINSVISYTTTFNEVKAQIDSAFTFPICNTLTTAGHLTLAVGYVNNQHTLIFNDPYGNKNNGTWPNYSGTNSYYDWPGYNNGYENLNSVAWTVTAHSAEPVYNDTIIDDVSYNHGFYMHNQGTSHMKYYRDKKTGGYNSHFWYTYTSASSTTDTCYVTWTPAISTAANYEVFTYVPSTNANATAARYKVYYSGGSQTVVINQAQSNGWVSLGIFPFAAGTAGYVRLGDAAGTQGQMIAFDAVKFEQVNLSTGISEAGSQQISIFPNPCADKLFISGTGVRRTIVYNVLGEIEMESKNETTLSLSSLASGIYFVSVFDEQNKLLKSEKIVKE